MRDAVDIFTTELPGFPPLPPPPPKKAPQDQRREAMGFQGPRIRTGCQFCHHAAILVLNPDSVFEVEHMRCSKGNFPVQRGAICNEFTAA